MSLPSEAEYQEFLAWKEGRVEQEEWDEDPRAAYLQALENIPDGDQEGVRRLIEKYNAHMRAARGEEEEPPVELSPEEQEEADAKFHAAIDAVPDGDREGLRQVLRDHGRLGGES